MKIIISSKFTEIFFLIEEISKIFLMININQIQPSKIITDNMQQEKKIKSKLLMLC